MSYYPALESWSWPRPAAGPPAGCSWQCLVRLWKDPRMKTPQALGTLLQYLSTLTERKGFLVFRWDLAAFNLSCQWAPLRRAWLHRFPSIPSGVCLHGESPLSLLKAEQSSLPRLLPILKMSQSLRDTYGPSYKKVSLLHPVAWLLECNPTDGLPQGLYVGTDIALVSHRRLYCPLEAQQPTWRGWGNGSRVSPALGWAGTAQCMPGQPTNGVKLYSDKLLGRGLVPSL